MHYIIVATINDPYPKKFEQRVNASNIGTAINRGIGAMRKDELKGKRIKEIVVKAVRV